MGTGAAKRPALGLMQSNTMRVCVVQEGKGGRRGVVCHAAANLRFWLARDRLRPVAWHAIPVLRHALFQPQQL